MIGIYICQNCSLPSIKYMEDRDAEWQICPSCGAVMNLQSERLDKVEKEWIKTMKECQ